MRRSGSGSTRRVPIGSGRSRRRCGAVRRWRSSTAARRSTRGSCATSRSWSRGSGISPRRPSASARRCCGPPNSGVSLIAVWRTCGGRRRISSARSARGRTCGRCSSASTRARPSSRRTRHISTPRTKMSAKHAPRVGERLRFSAGGRIESDKESSSTTAACTRPTHSPTPASRRSWSTATRRRSPPTTTPATGSISSRSRSRTCSRSSRWRSPRA